MINWYDNRRLQSFYGTDYRLYIFLLLTYEVTFEKKNYHIGSVKGSLGWCSIVLGLEVNFRAQSYESYSSIRSVAPKTTAFFLTWTTFSLSSLNPFVDSIHQLTYRIYIFTFTVLGLSSLLVCERGLLWEARLSVSQAPVMYQAGFYQNDGSFTFVLVTYHKILINT